MRLQPRAELPDPRAFRMAPRRAFALISLLVGLSFSGAHLTGLGSLGHDYHPFLYNPIYLRLRPQPKFLYVPATVAYDETTEYARFTREVLRGELSGNTIETYQPYVLDPIRSRTLWWRDRLGPLVLALLAIPFSGSVAAVFILADFLFPALAAWALLWLGWRLRADLSFGILVVAAVLWFNWYDMLGWISRLGGAPWEQPIFARTTNPQFSIPLFVAFLIALARLRERPGLTPALVLGVVLALNFYAYFYSWTFAVAMLAGLPLAVWLAPGGGDRWRFLLLAVGAAALAAALALPVWGGVVFGSSLAQDSFVRGMGQFTHRPDLPRALPSFFFLLVTAALARRTWPNAWLWLLFWLASLLTMNQQVLTGKKLHPDHYLAYFIEPFAVVFLLDVGFWLRGQLRREPRWLVPALATAMLVLGSGQNFYRLHQYFTDTRTFYTWDPAFRQVTDLLARPEWHSYGYLTNDFYLDEMVAAYVRQKPLATKLMNPITDRDRNALLRATHSLGAPGAPGPPAPLRFNPEKILLIFNKHEALPIDRAACRPLLENRDFLVARLLGTGPQL